jgi:hypothetical protein
MVQRWSRVAQGTVPPEPKPKKAYEVERISRCVTTVLVYADSAEDAKRRSAVEGDGQDAEYFGKGFGQVRRNEDKDRR